jgi:D-arabinose 1-dehydrogenase-like Zn-dependent alcohol dehydrogenase
MSGKMKAAQISRAGGDWELVERDLSEPGPAHVRVKVEACGICHSDVLVKDGLWPGLQYPRVPGHEIAGRIDTIGGGVTAWTEGQRVAVGWHGGHCYRRAESQASCARDWNPELGRYRPAKGNDFVRAPEECGDRTVAAGMTVLSMTYRADTHSAIPAECCRQDFERHQ